MECRRRALVWMGVLVLGCGPDTQPQWRACDEAFAALPAPKRPTTRTSIVPVMVGESLPTMEFAAREEDGEALANRALALACVVTDGDATATDALVPWAEQALTADTLSADQRLFDPPVLPLYFNHPGELPELSITVVPPDDGTMDGQPRMPPPDIGADAIRERTSEILATLRKHGLVADVEHETVLGVEQGSHVDLATGKVTQTVEGYLAYFFPKYAGVRMLGPYASLRLEPNGTVISIRVIPVDAEVRGSVTAAVDQADAEARFLELATMMHPDSEVRLDRDGFVAYLATPTGKKKVVEPVWSGAFLVVTAKGVVGTPQAYTLSLTDPNAQLVGPD